MPTIVDCPSCGRKLNVPDEYLGARVRCPACATEFTGGTAPSPEPAYPPAKEATAPRDLALDPTPPPPDALTSSARGLEPALPPPVADGVLMPCPSCGERVSRTAVTCPRCGENLEEGEERPWERPYRRPVRRDCEPHRGTLVLVFGILSLVIGYIGLPLGIAAWVMGRADLAKMKAGSMDPEGRGLTQAGWVCGIIGTIYQSFLVLLCVAYVAFMATMVGVSAKSRPAPPPPALSPAPPPPPPLPQ